MTWSRARPRAYRVLTLALLCAGFTIFACDALAHDALQVGQSPPQSKLNTSAEIPVWRTITLGTYKGVSGYRKALDKAAMKIGDSADEILGRPAFPYGRTRRDLDLVLLSVAELGVKTETASLSDIYKRAIQFGLELCPPEAGPQLRLDYSNQPLGEFLYLAMEPVATYGGDLTILTVANGGAGLLLIGTDGRPDVTVLQNWRFVFVLPRFKQRLEVSNPQ
jgi:hypothetical protein